ncbi:pseudouridine synthase [Mongoliimonas terrestris]|uniref:pseudouridine synthase n=1 Tax=Mongoliimonas terrestris TaxID=1709001 RepID=UPI00094955EE|nr:pseudouridine synthase [Mongoliimonas terrestris]
MKTPKTSTPTAPKSAPERIAKVIARAGLCSRREAETWIEDGRVSLNGKTLATPAVTVGPDDVVLVDGLPLPSADRTRLWLFHKPRGCVTTTRDPEGRPTVFDLLPPDLPRVMTVGRLDINTEGLLLLTNDGGLARVLELPSTGWLRRYRVRVHGSVEQAELDKLRDGVAIDGILYGAVEATLERKQGVNAWLSMGLREGKNREVKNILGHLGLDVTRLIRVSFGPFQLGDLDDGAVEEVPRRVLKEQLGPTLVAQSGADFAVREEDRLPQMPIRSRRSADADDAGGATPMRRDRAPAGRPRPDAEPPEARAERVRAPARRIEREAPARPGAERAPALRDRNADGRRPDARSSRRRHEADIEHANEETAQRNQGRNRLTLSAREGAERRERAVTEVRQATRGDVKAKPRGDMRFSSEVRPRRERDLDETPRAAPRERPDRTLARDVDGPAKRPVRAAGAAPRPAKTRDREKPEVDGPESRRAEKIRLAREKRAGSPMPGRTEARARPATGGRGRAADADRPERPRADKPRPDTRLDTGDGPRRTGRPERPSGGRDERSATGRGERAVVARAERPASGRAERPATGRAERPATGRAERPATGRAERPATGRAERPATGRAERSAAGRAERSAAGRAERPAEGRGGAPRAERPTKGRGPVGDAPARAPRDESRRPDGGARPQGGGRPRPDGGGRSGPGGGKPRGRDADRRR